MKKAKIYFEHGGYKIVKVIDDRTFLRKIQDSVFYKKIKQIIKIIFNK